MKILNVMRKKNNRRIAAKTKLKKIVFKFLRRVFEVQEKRETPIAN